MEDLQYPIGKHEAKPFSEKEWKERLLHIQTLPLHLEYAILNLDEAQLNSPYRPGGWTVTQLVHHVADSHMNAYMRFKLALTEDNPTIKPYDQDLWAGLPDSANLPTNISTTLLFSLHHRWHEILKHLPEADLQKTIYHPEYKKTITLWELMGTYAWHGRHHVAHITSLKKRMGW